MCNIMIVDSYEIDIDGFVQERRNSIATAPELFLH